MMIAFRVFSNFSVELGAISRRAPCTTVSFIHKLNSKAAHKIFKSCCLQRPGGKPKLSGGKKNFNMALDKLRSMTSLTMHLVKAGQRFLKNNNKNQDTKKHKNSGPLKAHFTMYSWI